MTQIGVLGGGAFGTALAVVAQQANKVPSPIWVRSDPDTQRTTNLADLEICDTLIYAIKAQALPAILPQLLEANLAHKNLLIAAKGLLSGDEAFLHQAVEASGWTGDVGLISGPGFARDIKEQKPFAVTIAARDINLAREFCRLLATPTFRPYASEDRVGVALGGALKNIVAIACGITTSIGFGESARAAVMTRGLAEINRLGQALGARSKTFSGLSGVGDLALTCTSELSRNYQFGLAVGRGAEIETAKTAIGTVEGLATIKAALKLAAKHSIDLPIAEQLHKALFENQSLSTSIENLLSRQAGIE